MRLCEKRTTVTFEYKCVVAKRKGETNTSWKTQNLPAVAI